MKMKEHYTDDWGNFDEPQYNNALGKLLRERLDSGIVPIRCTTDELEKKPPVTIERKKPMDIENTLEQRGNNYGDYREVAFTAQEMKLALRRTKSWPHMEAYMQESLDMMCNKMSRIVNGNPYYDDSWVDIAGYATLVVKQLEKK